MEDGAERPAPSSIVHPRGLCQMRRDCNTLPFQYLVDTLESCSIRDGSIRGILRHRLVTRAEPAPTARGVARVYDRRVCAIGADQCICCLTVAGARGGGQS